MGGPLSALSALSQLSVIRVLDVQVINIKTKACNLPQFTEFTVWDHWDDWICYMIENWRRASQNAKFLLTANADNCSYHSYRLISLILTHTDSYRLISLISAHMLVLDHHINESKHSRLLPNKAMTAMNCKKVTMN